MPASGRRWFAVPRDTERAVLLFFGLWLLAHACARLLYAVDHIGAMLLPPIETSHNSWQPQHPLGRYPFLAEVFVNRVALPFPFLFIALGLAMWPHADKRRRYMMMWLCVDALVVVALAQAVWDGPRSNAMSYAMHQLQTAPLVGIALLMAWPTRRGRALALGGAAALAVVYACIYWFDGSLGIPLPRATGVMTLVAATMDCLRVASPALLGAGILLAARAARPPSAAPAPADAPAHA